MKADPFSVMSAKLETIAKLLNTDEVRARVTKDRLRRAKLL
jgi:hypothetical protein